MAASDYIVKADQLAKTYVLGFFRKKICATSSVTFSVERGEIFGLLGPNGAGKTTTMKLLLGLVKPTAGTAELLGRPLGDVEAKNQLGYLPESPYFYEYLTPRELLQFTADLFGLDRATTRKRSGELIEQVGLAEAADRQLRRFSKGMLQRIGLAQALINDPELVILDEPMTGLNPIGRKHVRELVYGLRTAGKTVILSSHILSDVELLADRVTIVVQGKTVETGRLDQLVDARVLATEIVIGEASSELLGTLAQAGHETITVAEEHQVVIGAQTSLEQTIALIHDKGGSIRSVTPRKETLEDVVVRRALAAGA